MTYEKYKAWITDKNFDGQFWWVPDKPVRVPNTTNYFFHSFRSRMTVLRTDGNMRGQYIGLRFNGMVEIGEFDCGHQIGNMYRSYTEYCSYNRCNIEKTELIRIAYKNYGCYPDAIKALSQKKTLIGNIFDTTNVQTLCADVTFYKPTVSDIKF